MMIANVTTNESITTKEAQFITADEFMSNDINELSNAQNQWFRLNPLKLNDFNTVFTQWRFYCHKKNHTIHLSTTLPSVWNYFMLNTIVKPKSCGSFIKYEDDNSILAASCDRWVNRAWGYTLVADRLYKFPFYIEGECHFGLSGGRLECDDIFGGYVGVWKIFVR